jgi:protein-tyrosine phosphatase
MIEKTMNDTATVGTLVGTNGTTLTGTLVGTTATVGTLPSTSFSMGTPPRTLPTGRFSTVFIGELRFIIMDCPTLETVELYANELFLRGVKQVIRLCEPTYPKEIMNSKGIQLVDLPFTDGGTPPPEVITQFLSIIHSTFGSVQLDPQVIQSQSVTIIEDAPVIAIHCVAGLGRAPLLVAIALIESGMAPIDAVDFIRKCRRGAFNAIQLKYLIDTYKKRKQSISSGFGNFLRRTPTPPKDLVSSQDSLFKKLLKMGKNTLSSSGKSVSIHS